MGEYVIEGGRKLTGEITIAGGKNAVLPILAATVLNAGESIIENCPKISDVFTSILILQAIGCTVRWEGNTLVVNSANMDNYIVPEEYVREMRSSIIFLGAVLARCKKVVISYPGGCELGARPIDLHLKALRQMGAYIDEEKGDLICEAAALSGTEINLDFPSVGATQNIMLASVFANGTTTIVNAAKEPEIIELQYFLRNMGADIDGAGSDIIVIKGGAKLKPAHYRVLPDRIVAGTYLTAAAMTGGSLRITDIEPFTLHPVLSKLRESGCSITEELDSVYLKSPPQLSALRSIRTHPHPGLASGNKGSFNQQNNAPL